MNVREVVGRGVALLDRKGPPDWRQRVKDGGPLTGAAMNSVEECIIGRVFGSRSPGSWSYDAALRSLGITSIRAEEEHGFTLGFFGSDGSWAERMNKLAEGWSEALGLEVAEGV